jgi:hypothetical protein
MSTTWKSRLGDLERLIKGSGNRAFEIATELRELWKDKEFLVDCNGSLDEAEEKLSRYADATGYHLNELLQMLEHFPKAEDWKDGHIRHVYDETCKAIAGRKRPNDSEPRPKARRVSLAELEVVQRERDEYARQARELKAEVKRLREENLLLIKKLPGKAA